MGLWPATYVTRVDGICVMVSRPCECAHGTVCVCIYGRVWAPCERMHGVMRAFFFFLMLCVQVCVTTWAPLSTCAWGCACTSGNAFMC